MIEKPEIKIIYSENRLMERDNSRPWYFLHIPKTAGTTFRVLLENCFHMEEICPAYEFFQIKQYSEEQLLHFRLFRGHMGYNLINYLPVKPRTLVMLRDPMERAVSHFEYIRRDPGHPKHQFIRERKLGLKEYLLDPVLSAEVTNAQVRPLAHTATRRVLQKLLDNSDSQDNFARAWRHTQGVLPPDDELLDVAMQRLEIMDFVGVAEHLDRGLQLAAWLLGARPQQQMQSLNINPCRTRLEDLPEDTLDILKQVTALDARLYARGLEHFEAQYQRMTNSTEGNGRSFSTCTPTPEGSDGALSVDFTQPLYGSGWHQRELVPGKGVLRWTGPGNTSDIEVALPKGPGYRMRIVIADLVCEEVLRSLAVFVNGVEVPVTLSGDDQAMYALADIDASLLPDERTSVRISLRVSHAGVQSGMESAAIDHSHARRVGIAVYRFEFTPNQNP